MVLADAGLAVLIRRSGSPIDASIQRVLDHQDPVDRGRVLIARRCRLLTFLVHAMLHGSHARCAAVAGGGMTARSGVALFVQESLHLPLQQLNPLCECADVRGYPAEPRRDELTTWLAGEQSRHCVPKSRIGREVTSRAAGVATATQCWVQDVEGDHLCGMAVVIVRELLVLPPVHVGNQFNVYANGRRAGDDAAVAPNEVLDQAPLKIPSDADICHPGAGPLTAIHCVHGWGRRDISP